MDSNDGGQAYPRVTKFYEARNAGDRNAYLHSIVETEGGMTLRDWFAGQALAGFASGLSSAPVDDEGKAPRAMDRVVFSELVRDAFTVADAMLAERSKP